MLGAAASSAVLQERQQLDIAVLKAFGCSNPVGVSELQQGETVLILCAGSGIDVLLSAERVGPAGRAIGLDDSDDLLAAAREDAAETAVTNVEFLEGDVAAIPLPATSADVVLGSYVTKLAPDRAAVFCEIARVLRPAGRMTITELVAEGPDSPGGPGSVGRPTALSSAEIQAAVLAAGFATVTLSPLQAVARGLVAATVRATKPPRAAEQD